MTMLPTPRLALTTWDSEDDPVLRVMLNADHGRIDPRVMIDSQGAPLSARPAAATAGAGTWWTDTAAGITYRSDGTTWQQVTATVIDASNDQPKPLTPGAPGAAGAAGQASRADHSHAMAVHDIAAHASIPLSVYAPATAAIDMGGHPMTGLATPEDSNDAATRDYADRMLG